MGRLDQLRSFYRRRIALPPDIGPQSLVLDVGSGDKPHWRADVLVDRFPEAEHAVQRSGSAAARTLRPLFDADAADLPFADQVFDFVICSHLLEHVLDPGAAIGEMVRVAKAGYVEVPRAAGSKIIDFPSHLWWCREEDEMLVFESKQHSAFDPEIEAFVRRPNLEREFTALIDRCLDEFVIARHWTGDLPHRVVGTVDPDLVAHIANLAPDEMRHKQAETVATRALTTVLSLPLRRRRRRGVVRYDEIVKPEYWRGDATALQPRRYTAGTDTGIG